MFVRLFELAMDSILDLNHYVGGGAVVAPIDF